VWHRVVATCLFLAALCLGNGASAIEIGRFDVSILLGQDSTFVVTESIEVDFGDQRKHGIFRTIPGVGLLTATALVAFRGDVHRFRSCRHFASYLGLTSRERSSGTTRRLVRISKQGHAYLRMLLTHGARAVLWAAKKHSQPDRLCHWALELEHRRGHNKATIALANKLARTAGAVWKRGTEYQSLPKAA